MNVNADNTQKKETIILRITDEIQNTQAYNRDIEELLEKYIKLFISSLKEDYSSSFLFILYSGDSIWPDKFNRPIREIIKPRDKKDKKMTLILCRNNEFDKHDLDKIKIILSIEEIKKEELEGIKGETIKDIISKSSIIKIDLKWCNFQYKGKEFDICNKFDEIANNEDRNKSEIIITVNYIIPLIVNFVNKSKKKYKVVKC